MSKAEWIIMKIYKDEYITDTTSRMKVPGGWLVKNRHSRQAVGKRDITALAMSFVSDPDHKWTIDE